MKNLICSIVLCLFLVSCAPKPFVPSYTPADVKFEQTLPHRVDLAPIDDLKGNFTPFRVVFVDDDITPVIDMKDATKVIMTTAEFKNFGVAMEMKKAYRNAIVSEVQLTNQYIDIINSLKEYVALEELKAKEYRQMWIDSENAYQKEAYDHRWDNNMNKVLHYLTIGGGIALLIAL